jgi:hypothetical protein
MSKTYTSTTQGSSRTHELVEDGEPTEAVPMSTPSNGSSRGVPDVARAPAAARGGGASATWPDHRAAPTRPLKPSVVGLGQEPSIAGRHTSAVPPEGISAEHDHRRRATPAAKNPLVSPLPWQPTTATQCLLSGSSARLLPAPPSSARRTSTRPHTTLTSANTLDNLKGCGFDPDSTRGPPNPKRAVPDLQ